MACGAAALLRGIACWRYLCRNWGAMQSFILALMGGAAHTGTEAQANLNVVAVILLLKYMRPPSMMAITTTTDDSDTQTKSGSGSGSGDQALVVTTTTPVSETASATAASICEISASAAVGGTTTATTTNTTTTTTTTNTTTTTTIGGGGPLLPWRYTVAANCYPLLFLPALSPAAVVNLVNHFFLILDADVPISRHLGAGGLEILLMALWYPHAAKNTAASPLRSLSPESADAARTALSSILSSSQGVQLLPRLLTNIANSHLSLSGGTESKRSGLMQQFKDDAVPKTLLGNLLRGDWPGGRSTVPAVQKTHFLPVYARLIHLFCQVAPTSVIPALKAPLESRLTEKPQDADRQSTAAAVEALAGILASGAVFTTTTTTTSSVVVVDESYSWVCSLFCGGMAAAPLELVDVWCAGLRYALHELAAAQRHDLVAHLLEMTIASQSSSHAVPGGGGDENGTTTKTTTTTTSSGALFKQIQYAREGLEELTLATGVAAAPPTLRTLLDRLLTELPLLVKGHGEMVRRAAAALTSEVCLSLLFFTLPPSDGGVDRNSDDNNNSNDVELMALRGKAIAFMSQLISEFDAAAGVLYDHVRTVGSGDGGGNGGATVLTLNTTTTTTMSDGDDGDEFGPSSQKSMEDESTDDEGEEIIEEEEEIEEEGGDDVLMSADGGITATTTAHQHQAENNILLLSSSQQLQEDASVAQMDVEESLLAATSSHDAAYQSAVATVAFSVEWIVQMLASNAAAAAPWIVRALPSLLRLQELVPSELQFVALVSRKALVAAKYQPLGVEEAEQVLEVLLKASRAELWPERGSSLIFCQYFWFRHALLLGSQGTSKVVDMVLERLEDEKLEVRELAGTTLSGLIRGLSPSEAASLRRRFLQKAIEVFPTRNRRRRIDTTTTTVGPSTFGSTSSTPVLLPLPVRHGAALSLQALVLSSPYDVPLWLPEVLMALVRLASEPSPIKSTVMKALGEFRRTHEEGGLVEAKEALTAEQWEAIRDVASPASYFV